MGAFFDIPESMFTDTEHRIANKRWQFEKYCRETLDNLEKTLVIILKNAIEKLYHTEDTIMVAMGFRTLTAPKIISRMQ